MEKREVKQLRNWLKNIKALNCIFTIHKIQGDERYELEVKYYFHKNKSPIYLGRILPNTCMTRGKKGFAYFVYNLAQEITLHEFNEHFTIDKKRVMNPHFTGYSELRRI